MVFMESNMTRDKKGKESWDCSQSRPLPPRKVLKNVIETFPENIQEVLAQIVNERLPAPKRTKKEQAELEELCAIVDDYLPENSYYA